MTVKRKLDTKSIRAKSIHSIIMVLVIGTALGISVMSGSIGVLSVFAQQFAEPGADLSGGGGAGNATDGNMTADGNITQAMPSTTGTTTDGEGGGEEEGDGGSEGEGEDDEEQDDENDGSN